MEARELRIGNLIDYEGQYLPVLAIDNEREFFHTERNELIKCSITLGQYDDNGFMWTTNGRWLKRLKPIPLTEEWLLKFGFEPSNFKKGCYFLNGRLLVPKEGYYFDYGASVNLKHVHQLQNFYFALTVEELELKQ